MISGKILRDAIISGANNINNQRSRVDELNVFPVPDGDTGTNMGMTVGAAVRELEALDDSCTVGESAKTAASAMLRGARGNSGVITSLLFRGFSKALEGKKEADAADIVAALQKGVEGAYKAVMKPTEGTILTVAREAAEKGRGVAVNDPSVEAVWAAVCDEAEASLQRTPDLLPVLKKAGVVDAGGQGFCIVIRAMQHVMEGGAIVEGDAAAAGTKTRAVSAAGSFEADITFTYCTEFIVARDKGNDRDPLRLRAYLESIGDCVVVVDDSDIIKVHVHSNCPGDVIQAALKYGQLINIKIDNMRYQHRNAEEGVKQGDTPPQPTVVQPENDYGFVAVCAGDGLKELFTDIGADTVVSGGQTMNPSTDDILNAIMATPAKTVFVLPNNKNIIMAAEQAIPLAKDRQVRVLQTKTIPQGISAMLVFDETQSADDNQMAMMDAAAHVETGSVTFAARDSELDGRPIKKGEIMGMCGSKIKFLGDDIVDIAFKTVDKLFKRGEHALVTLIYGADATEEQAQALENRLSEKYGSDMEISIVDGGQPIYYFLLSVE